MSLDGGKGWFRFYGRGFLFIIILGEMLLTEIKITIKNTAEQYKIPLKKTDLTIHTCMLFDTKTVKP